MCEQDFHYCQKGTEYIPRVSSRAHDAASIHVDDSIAASRPFGRIRSLEALVSRGGRLVDTRTALHDVEIEMA
jgi:hypothetical protein